MPEDLHMAKSGNLKSKTESFLIAAHYKVIRTKYIKVKSDYTLENSRYRLCTDKMKKSDKWICGQKWNEN